MPRFAAIEGLRAWLAWAVVFSHIAQSLGVGMHGGHAVWFEYAGGTGVTVFIAISGFVIAGLVIDKAEPWPRYITRRAFRIFPAYWVAYAGALLALPLGVAALSHLPWLADPAFDYDEILNSWAKAMADHPWQQLALHITLFQGVVPDSIWPSTSTAALGPAWSLTLEWQFYLIAPVFVWLLAQDRYRMAFTILVAALGVAFHGGLFGQYNLPSFLPGSGYLFLMGAACRLSFDRIKTIPVGPEIIPFALAIGFIFPLLFWLAVWVSFIAYLARRDVWLAAGSGRRVVKAMDAMLASRLAGWFGARSYSVYLVHFPIIMAVSLPLLSRFQLDQTQAFLALAVVVIPLALIASEIMHRLVERPMMVVGAWLARPRPPRTPAAEGPVQP